MHKLADYIQSKINIPLIHIADCVAQKCITNEVFDVGLLGTKYTIIEDFLIKRFENAGICNDDKVAVMFDEKGNVMAIGKIGENIWIDANDNFKNKTFAELNIVITSLKVY